MKQSLLIIWKTRTSHLITGTARNEKIIQFVYLSLSNKRYKYKWHRKTENMKMDY